VGVEGRRRDVFDHAKTLGVPVLVSANSLWDNERQKFRGWRRYLDYDTTLDSGGFVAMKQYGGFRFSAEQYATLARDMRPTWWAQMDFCCEPEIAADQRVVFQRIDMTVEQLHECRRAAASCGAPPPTPVLQGWAPADYCQGPAYDQGFQWPDLVGIGSVCRRSLHGPAGIMAVMEALNAKVPPHVKFHLFGVKSTAVARIIEHFPNRVASIDSMAWSSAARWEAYLRKVSCNSGLRISHLDRWVNKQAVVVNEAEKEPTLWSLLK